MPQGGPQTETGKAVSKFNALTHGILRETLSEYEQGVEDGLLDDLETEYRPASTIERMLLERIATTYVKLRRVAKAEREFMRSVLDPHVVVTKSIPGFEVLQVTHTVVEREGYVPKLGFEAVNQLASVYGRYETNLENRLYRAVRELREQRAVKTTA